VLAHERDPLVVDERPVLDGPHTGAHGVLDPLGAVRVRCTKAPYFAASSTAARISSSLNSATPGFVPGVSTAPVAITLIRSAPPLSS
jgi:hypothetical protein